MIGLAITWMITIIIPDISLCDVQVLLQVPLKALWCVDVQDCRWAIFGRCVGRFGGHAWEICGDSLGMCWGHVWEIRGGLSVQCLHSFWEGSGRNKSIEHQYQQPIDYPWWYNLQKGFLLGGRVVPYTEQHLSIVFVWNNSVHVPWTWKGASIGGNGSYKPPGAPTPSRTPVSYTHLTLPTTPYV